MMLSNTLKHYSSDDTNRKNKPSVIDVKEKQNCKRFWNKNRASESTDETV
jgi:hypothetical protein